MARNRSQMLTYIKYDFKRDDKDTEIYVAYNDTLRHLSNFKALEGRKFQSYIPMVAGQEDYPLPSSKIHVLHPIRFIESASDSNGYPLIKISKEEFSERYPNPNSTGTSVPRGRPQHYTVYSDSILVGPLPDLSTYLLEADWAKISTSQDSDSDIQELGEEWEEVIKFGVLMRLYAGLGMDTEAAKWKSLYESEDYGFRLLISNQEEQTERMGTVRNNNL